MPRPYSRILQLSKASKWLSSAGTKARHKKEKRRACSQTRTCTHTSSITRSTRKLLNRTGRSRRRSLSLDWASWKKNSVPKWSYSKQRSCIRSSFSFSTSWTIMKLQLTAQWFRIGFTKWCKLFRRSSNPKGSSLISKKDRWGNPKYMRSNRKHRLWSSLSYRRRLWRRSPLIKQMRQAQKTKAGTSQLCHRPYSLNPFQNNQRKMKRKKIYSTQERRRSNSG